jgi:DinB superfamily
MPESPAWQLDPWSEADGFAKIGQQSDRVRGLLLDDSVFPLRSSRISLWSAGEHAGHIAMVNLRMAKAIMTTLESPELHRHETTGPGTTALLEAGEAPRGVAEAPAMVRPEDRTREEFLSILGEAVGCWTRLEGRASEIAACRGRFEHSRLGFMTPHEWVRMCSLHAAHHLRIINDISGSWPGVGPPAETLDPGGC